MKLHLDKNKIPITICTHSLTSAGNSSMFGNEIS